MFSSSDDDPRRAMLYWAFFDECSIFGDECDTIIQEAVDKFPAENDFDKRHYYVAEKLHAFEEERRKALREKKVKES